MWAILVKALSRDLCVTNSFLFVPLFLIYSDNTNNMPVNCKGGACCVFSCRKIRKCKNDGARSSSEGSDDEESEIKMKYPRTFHR